MKRAGSEEGSVASMMRGSSADAMAMPATSPAHPATRRMKPRR
jgi:hypothetical protein